MLSEYQWEIVGRCPYESCQEPIWYNEDEDQFRTCDCLVGVDLRHLLYDEEGEDDTDRDNGTY